MQTVYLLSSNVCISSSVSINLYRSNSSWSNIFILIKFYWQVDILAVVLGKTLNKNVCHGVNTNYLDHRKYLMMCQKFYCNESVFQRKSTCGHHTRWAGIGGEEVTWPDAHLWLVVTTRTRRGTRGDTWRRGTWRTWASSAATAPNPSKPGRAWGNMWRELTE